MTSPVPQAQSVGRFIAIEGLDGSGGSTQLAALAARLSARGQAFVRTREPSDGPVGRLIRAAFREGDPASVLGDAPIAYLFAADRRDHLARTIEPALNSGTWVLSDRYLPSSLAYQSPAVGFEEVVHLNRGLRAPDLTIFLDLPVNLCVERIEARGGHPERFDSALRLQVVYEAYDRARAYCRGAGFRWADIDARGSIVEVEDRVWAEVAPFLEDNRA
jgi:dTMP kinase